MDLPGLFLILLLGLFASWIWLTLYTAWMLTLPPRRSYAWAVARSLPGDPSELRLPGRPSDHAINFEGWTFRSRDLDLPVWDIRGEDPFGPVVVLTHGWGDSRTTMLGSGRVAGLLPHVSRLLVWDLPGHGDAAGRCSLGADETRDLEALIDRLAAESDGSCPERCGSLILYGFSLGAVITLRALQHPGVKAIIAEAPYLSPVTPAQNTLLHRGFPHRSNVRPALAALNALYRGRLDTPRALNPRGGDKPILVIHGIDDVITPFEDGQRIAAQLDAQFVPIPGGQHVSMFSVPATQSPAVEAISKFLASLRDERLIIERTRLEGRD